MHMYEPTNSIKQTAKNAKLFVKEHSVLVWDLLTPIIPIIFAIYLLDIVLAELLFDKPKGVILQKDVFGNYRAVKQTKPMGVGLNILSMYFYFVFMVSWIRVCLKGTGQKIMSPIKPKKSELKLLGTLLLVGFAMGAALIIGSYIVAQAGKLAVLIYLCLGVLFIVYACVRLNFYFAALATGDKITLSEAYALGDGYVWKIFASGFLANLKFILLSFVYIFVASFCIHFAGKNIISEHTVYYLKFCFIMMPCALYFYPIMYAHSTAVVAGYYKYVTSNVIVPTVGADEAPKRKIDPEQRARAREREEIRKEELF